MPRLAEVCRHVRSKNAGPYWITLDLTFPDRESFDRHVDAPALQPEARKVQPCPRASSGSIRKHQPSPQWATPATAVASAASPSPAPSASW